MNCAGFFDLNINSEAINDSDKLFKRLVEFGYRTVAINQVIEETSFNPGKTKKRKGEQFVANAVPPPISVELPEELKGKIRILNRLSVQFSDASQFLKVSQSEHLKNYHLLAVIPMNENAYQHTCLSLNVDIISIPHSERVSGFNRKLYNLAVSKNMFFELSYAPALNCSSNLRDIINLGHVLHAVGKSKNVILTSGATSYMQLRGPYDLVNLGILYGLSQGQAKNSITTLSKNAISKGDGRRLGKAIMTITEIDKITDKKGENKDMKIDEEDETMDDSTQNCKRAKT